MTVYKVIVTVAQSKDKDKDKEKVDFKCLVVAKCPYDAIQKITDKITLDNLYFYDCQIIASEEIDILLL